MPNYFDPILQCDVEIEVTGATTLYLVEMGGRYSIKGLSSDYLEQVGSDPHTLALQYWPINNLSELFITIQRKELEDVIFPNQQLTTEPLSLELVQSLGIDPSVEAPIVFSGTIRERLKDEAHNDRITDEGVTLLVRNYFYDRINHDNYFDLCSAWDELQHGGAIISRRSKAAINELNITPDMIEYFIIFLTHETFSFNSQNQAYIESFWPLNERYPTHFERFANQVDFGTLLLNYNEEFSGELDDVVEQSSNDDSFDDYSDESDSMESENDTALTSDITETIQVQETTQSVSPFHNRDDRFFSRALTPDMMTFLDRALHEFVRAHFRDAITRENVRAIEGAWEEYSRGDVLTVTAHSHLAQLNIPESAQMNFLESIAEQYPNMNEQHRTHLLNKFSLNTEYTLHACFFGERVNLAGILLEHVEQFFPHSYRL